MGVGMHLASGVAVALERECCHVTHGIHVRVAGTQMAVHLPPAITPVSQS